MRDGSGSVVAGARVEVLTSGGGSGSGAILWEGRTGIDGRFEAPHGAWAAGRLRVSAEGFAVWEGPWSAEVRLTPQASYSSITVATTPTARGAVEVVEDSPHVAVVKTEEPLHAQPLPTIGQALAAEPGILLQQSTYAQSSPFLRGLTGYQVLNLLDGIRFNNSTFRSGPNQYLAYIEPGQVQRVEAVLGPTGVSWGSDSLGGTISVLTEQPSFVDERDKATVHGRAQLSGATADASMMGAGSVAVSTPRFFVLGGLSGRKHNDLRAGGGMDSRNAFHRFFGLSQETIQAMVGDRQQDSGFQQYGVEGRFAVRLKPDQLLTLNYQRGAQSNVRGYKDLLGGLGRLISTFEPQGLNWAYGRYEKLGWGWLDSLSGTFSFNSQTDGGRRQNLSYTDSLTTDWAKVDVYGYSGQATMHRGARLTASFGGDIYDERIGSTRTVLNPVSGLTTRPRPLYPDGSKYANVGVFGQGSYQISSRLRAAAGVRWTGVRFATAADPRYRIPEASQWYRDVTFQSSLQWQATGALAFSGVASRGFRAPNLNDLGAVGLNDLGFEIPVVDAIPAGALLSSDAGEGALSKGAEVGALMPESMMNYEFAMRLKAGRFYGRAQFFDMELSDPITRRTLLFPVTHVPERLTGLKVTPIIPTPAQLAQGVVAVATEADPRAVKAFVNDGQSRYYGVETLGRLALTSRVSVEGNYSYILGRDLNPNRNIRRLPPVMGAVKMRYVQPGRRPWVEVALNVAAEQARLGGGDRDDERIGASFRRSDIVAFFRGSRAAEFTNQAGVFLPTGETLAQIQNRVLPIGATINGVRVVDDSTRVPMYLSTAGWTTVSVRSGLPLGERWQVNAALENLFDRNYRLHGSGVDAPGFSAWVGVRWQF
ncbi:MAG: TonB-dependent receptor [Acidobacteria bacterium]|nr:TonB-dependent receptor [Acidobacteriota bacterium]